MQPIHATPTPVYPHLDNGFPPVSGIDGQPDHELSVLVTSLSQGNQHAFTRLFNATRTQVYKLALRIVRDTAVAEDVTIEVYTQFYRQAATYDPDKGTPAAWLLTLTRCRAIDHLRGDALRRARETASGSAAFATTPPDPETQSVAREQQRVVHQTLTTLNAKQRQAIEMAYYDGCSHREIADRLGEPLGTVKTRIRMGLKVLRGRLHPLVSTDDPVDTALPARPYQ